MSPLKFHPSHTSLHISASFSTLPVVYAMSGHLPDIGAATAASHAVKRAIAVNSVKPSYFFV